MDPMAKAKAVDQLTRAVAAKIAGPSSRFAISSATIRGHHGIKTFTAVGDDPAAGGVPGSLGDWVRAKLAHRRARGEDTNDFIVFENERLTFDAFGRKVAALARALVDDLGVRRGDRVVCAMRNYPEWCVTFLAAVCAGAIVVPLNGWWRAPELEYGLRDSGAKHVSRPENHGTRK